MCIVNKDTIQNNTIQLTFEKVKLQNTYNIKQEQKTSKWMEIIYMYISTYISLYSSIDPDEYFWSKHEWVNRSVQR